MIHYLPRLLFPFLVPFPVWCFMAMLYENGTTDHGKYVGTGPSYSIGMDVFGILIGVVVAALLQMTVGLASLRLLRGVEECWKFVAFGMLFGSGFAMLSAWLFMFREFNETPFTLFGPSLLIFVPPFGIGYALAFHSESHKW